MTFAEMLRRDPSLAAKITRAPMSLRDHVRAAQGQEVHIYCLGRSASVQLGIEGNARVPSTSPKI